MKRLLIAGIVGIPALVFPSGIEALSRPELGLLAAGLRMPVGAVWLVGPMVLAVAGAVTVGWRRATIDGRSSSQNDR
jgi:hypothetical protein